jgi:hypothetical protein
MLAVAFVLVLLVVVAVAVALIRRPRGNDAHSVRNYNQALGTLEHLSERIGPPTVRPIARETPPGAPPGESGLVVPPVPVRGSDEFPDPDAPIVFDEARPANRTRMGVGAETMSSARSERAQRMALESMNRRRRGGTGIVIAVVVVGLLAGLAYIGRQKGHSDSHASTTTTVGRTGGGTGRSTTTSHPKSTRTTRPTPTTLPKQLVATSTSFGGASAEYSVPYASFQITATASGPCWVQVRSQASGNTVWQGVLSAGAVQKIQATGATTVELGTPSVTLVIDTIPVVLPSPLHTPFTATLNPPAAVSASTTTTTSAFG